MSRLAAIGRIATSLLAIAGVTAVYDRLLTANPTTIALTYLVVILVIAAGWGVTESMVASLAAVLCFNFFFLPPVGTLTIADPQNWVALAAFVITGVVASQLSGRARRRTLEALQRQRDLERLYALSRALLLLEPGISMASAIARRVAETFELRTVGLYDQAADVVAWAGPVDAVAAEGRLRDAARRVMWIRLPDGPLIFPIQLGNTTVGALALAPATFDDTVLHSVANLAAIGLERARAQEATARAEAAKESSDLRATVLDALAHEFKTPLTALKAAAAGLLDSTSIGSSDRELVAIIKEDVDRFQALVTDAVRMLRIDAGDFAVHLQRMPLRALVDIALRRFARRLEGHALTAGIDPDLTIDADPELLDLALRLLIDNALKYSPASSAITIGATPGEQHVEIGVHNTGSTIAEREQARVFERFYRGTQARHVPGTGLGLAIVQQIADVHGGSLAVSSSADAGTTFTVSLPRRNDPS